MLTPLQWAADSGSELLCACLLTAHAAVDSVGHHVDSFTPLHIASLHGHTAVAELLLEARANPQPMSISRDPRAPTTAPLHLACEQGHVDFARLLLQAKADPLLLDGDGDAPLHLAACGVNGKGHFDVVELLLHEGADPSTKRLKGGATAAKVTRDKRLRDMLLAAEAAPPSQAQPC